MKIAVLQHAAYEGPGEIAVWAAQHCYAVAIHHLYQGDVFPNLDDFDLLVVMGGEMNIYQDRDWPWLKPEREFISSALAAGKPAVGICLGAQLIADALGARVTQNAEYEIGWFPVRWTEESQEIFAALVPESTVLHWHGDTFSLPPAAIRLASSEGCPDQGFFIQGKCLALQFHLEVGDELVGLYVQSQAHWPEGRFVQKPPEILKEADRYPAANRSLLHGLLERFCRGLSAR